MGKNNRRLPLAPGLLVSALLSGLACTTDVSTQRVRIEIPAAPLIKGAETAEIVLVPFRLDKEIAGFDLNEDLSDYLRDQLKAKFAGRITDKAVSWPAGDASPDAAFWKNAALGKAGTVILTGKAAFSQEARKALLSTEKRKFDGPFEPQKKWAERRSFDLKLDIILVRAETGESLFQGAFQDSINYENMRQPAAFAFHDLLDRIRPKLFRFLFGSEKIQDRFLLLK